MTKSKKRTLNKNFPALIFSIVFYALYAAVNVYMSMLLGDIIDTITAGDENKLWYTIVICLIALVVSLTFVKIGLYFRMLFVKNTVVSLKAGIARGILSMPIRDFLKNDRSYYVNTATGDVDKIDQDFYCAIPIFVYYVCQFLFAFIMMCSINWLLLLVFVAFFMVPIFAPQLLSKKLEKQQKESSAANEAFLVTLTDLVSGLEAIRGAKAERQFIETFDKANTTQQEKSRRMRETRSFLNDFSNICGAFSQIGCMAFGALLALRGIVTAGNLIASIQLTNYCFQAVNVIGEKLASMKAVRPMREKCAQIQQDSLPTETEATRGKGVVNYQSVGFSFDNMPLFNNLNCSFETGKAYAVVGVSGAGKSTLLKLLLGYYEEYTGSILLDGKDISKMSESEIYTHIQYLPQNPYLFNASLLENVTLNRNCAPGKVDEVVKRVGLQSLFDQYGKDSGDISEKVSGGERQRIALARALLAEPEVMIFDEPTSALDPATSQAVMDLIFSMDGITRLVVTHNHEESILSRFDGVIQIEKAEIAQCFQ